MKRRGILRQLVVFFTLGVFLVWFLFPLYWVLNTSLKPPEETLSPFPTFWPRHLSMVNYVRLFTEFRFGQVLVNSVFISLATAGGILLVSIPMGYALARFTMPGKGGVAIVILVTQVFPMALLLIPIYVMFSRLGLVNNLLSLVLVYSAFFSAFNVLLIRGFFAGIPPELEESAMVDGCTRFGAFRRIAIPLTAPGLAASGIFAFVGAWNELVFATMFIHSEALQTLPVRLNMMMGEHSTVFGITAAGTVVSLIPALGFFMYAQRYLVTGIAAGAVKG
jgi:multiple sugar transport system permease protein